MASRQPLYHPRRTAFPQPSAACHWITMGESLRVLQPLDTRINRDAVTRLSGRHDTQRSRHIDGKYSRPASDRPADLVSANLRRPPLAETIWFHVKNIRSVGVPPARLGGGYFSYRPPAALPRGERCEIHRADPRACASIIERFRLRSWFNTIANRVQC